VADRLPVKKTYKLFIGGAFPRSESGRTYEAEGQNVARASRKDVRDSVRAARAAWPKWAGMTAYNRFDPTSPFGGYKESGFGREGGLHGLEPYLKFE
jgi:acyl-CoA reductase-like NAD-dependent aldehyde dehydrogenase